MQILCCALAATFVVEGASADVFGSRTRKAQFGDQTRVLDSRAAKQYANSVRLTPRAIETPTIWGSGVGYEGSYNGPFLDMARSAARRNNVPEGLFLRLVQQESGWRDTALSPKGAIGLAQIMPQTARLLNIDANDPYENLDGGARYLAQQYREFGSWPLALAAYNAGPHVVKRYGGIPPYKETKNYVKVIWGG
ncbi:lytic transglycosylase domain-containing protein [Pseudooceanicola sp. HF7]|uniref:lytic transglycosylase domain-containing protein n=1 Tax=Pseudooceanicola sp. HF7 TaxID=2721560 RepID=UPI0014315487|nr:lytic transglycosylase domain-containing protein [Pseudooceanicola sp. HF7]NIZ08834.1 lytic transglycosylase domain-containing protein [Pseudooceanicola sp. HF7]